MKRCLLLIPIALLLAGCDTTGSGGEVGSKNPSGHREYDITLLDGRTLHCVQIGSGNSESNTCDWASIDAEPREEEVPT